MTPGEIKEMQKRVGVEPDGFWGPISQAACKAHLRSLMPDINPWPSASQAALRAFYGAPGDESNLATLVFPYPMFYGGKSVKTTRVHRKCLPSLLRILASIGHAYGNRPAIMEEAQDYGGCYNFRMKRGGSTYSLHAYGAAIDLDADDNTFRDSWPMKSDMPLQIMEEFAREGWVAAGAFWGFDAMHFQATQ